ncbi:aminotransferase class V-fold PLP-dependent enzyme [Soehngenia longivitae]|jgi:cysteine desulfurase family protein|uniref:cysteine desulfurase n=1 Tax=Soehngenia longivitae TaxID=2562294 RepID=A0A4Z0D8Y3_9FIRM|nr:aminotransferase class V-fold PLP-dependent enzyme [Soehngenia longivitae]TFZ41315.1 aminotransferase class V-fold PLP-dependent enzyme [Soehngenia longivitae]
MYYFDNAATTFPKPDRVYDKVYEAMKEYAANPGRSGHKMALKANREVYDARVLISKFFHIEDCFNLIFTPNCTTALNMAIQGTLKEGDHVITTSMEHNSVLRPIKHLELLGVENTIVYADENGSISTDSIKKAIRTNTKMIAMTHVSNLTGTIMPIEEVGELAKSKGILFLVDASQSAGVIPIDVNKTNIDFLAFPGHKGLLGPQGTGGLFIRDGLRTDTIIQGGTGSESYSIYQPEIMPDKFESGTLNMPGIVGLKEGLNYILETGIENIRKKEEELSKFFIEELRKIEVVKIYGPTDIKQRVGVVPINIMDMDSSEISYILDDRYDIYVRPGLHCSPLAHETIGTMEQGAVRFSFGPFNTEEEVEYLIRAIFEITKQI